MPEKEKRKSNVGAALKKKRSWLVIWWGCGIFPDPKVKKNINLLR
jgi:hypothetical protein